jgi:hypothetical protein
LLTLHQNLVYVERKYSCVSDGKLCKLKKIILKNFFDITSRNQLRCNQEQCHAATYNYTYVDDAGKKNSMLIEYGTKIPRREVYIAGKKKFIFEFVFKFILILPDLIKIRIEYSLSVR